jgi:dTDP-4-dehydrorhamnose reductase
MLGQEVVRTFAQNKVAFSAFSRGAVTQNHFDFCDQTAYEIVDQLSLSEKSYIINCIGWIPQRASGIPGNDKKDAWKLNVRLPARLEEISVQLGVRVLQVATDCVFNGETGNYSESDEPNAEDLYGNTKREGEQLQPSAMRIRASIIGDDINTNAGLFSWYKSQPPSGNVTGFTNHIWNGVTTRALARLFMGIIANDGFVSGVQHWIPRDTVSKLTLLNLFRMYLKGTGASVTPGLGSSSVDRTLSTNNPLASNDYWGLAGYGPSPSIEDLVQEMIENSFQF